MERQDSKLIRRKGPESVVRVRLEWEMRFIVFFSSNIGFEIDGILATEETLCASLPYFSVAKRRTIGFRFQVILCAVGGARCC